MTVSVVEVARAAANTAPTLVTTPLPGDVLLMVTTSLRASAPRTVTTINGPGATNDLWPNWTHNAYLSTDSRIAFHVGINGEGAGTPSITWSGTGFDWFATLYLIRGLSSTTIAGVSTSTTGTTLTGTAQTADNGQVVVADAFGAGTITYPASTSPSSGWISQTVGTSGNAWTEGSTYRIPSASESHSTTATSASSMALGVASVVLGTASAPASTTGTVTATAPAATASITGTVTLPPTTGTVTATAPAAVAAFTGNVPGAPTTGTVNATAPAATASITGTVTPPPGTTTGVVSASAPAAVASITGATGDVFPESIRFGVGIGLRIEQRTVNPVDPRTNRVPVRLVVVDRFGTIVTELDRVQMDKAIEQIKDDDRFSFTLATSDPKAVHANPRNGNRLPEVQLWRGSVMLGWFVVVPDPRQSEDGATITFQCEDLSWYFKHRALDRRPRLQLLKNGNFASGNIDWWVAPNSRTEPVFQTWSVVDALESSSGKAVRLTGMGSALSKGHIRQRRRFTQPVAARYAMPVVVSGRVRLSPDAVLRDDGWVVHVLTASTANIGTVADYDTVSYEQKVLTFNDKWALDRFHPISLEVEIPPTGIEHIVEVRLYSPKTGYAEFIDFEMVPAEKFAYYNLDQGHIFKHLIEFAQSEAHGKDDLNIIGRTRRTGVYRPEFVRDYDQHYSVRSAIDELTSMYRGTDWDVVYWGGGVRQAVVYWPRMGSASGMVFELGGHVVRYQPIGGNLSNSIVVQDLSLSGAARTEAYAIDPAKLGGMVLESTFTAEEGTPIKDLDDTAQYALQTYGSPAASLRVQMNPRSTSELIDRVGKGDVVRVVIRDGLTNIDGNYRAVRRYFDPNTDTLEYDLAQEV